MAADDDGLGPGRDQTRNVRADDRFSEDRSAQDVTNRSVWRLPHLFQVEFCINELLEKGLARVYLTELTFHAFFVWSDGCTLDSHIVLLNCVGTVNRN